MFELDHHRRLQLEQTLGRQVTASELEPVASLSELRAEQLEVVKVLAVRQLLSALIYMRAVVPSALTGELMRFINQYA